MQDRPARLAWFKSVILPHEPALRRFVRRLATPDIDAEDIVSESLTRAYIAMDWQRIDRGRNYLFTIARHLLTDAARRRAVVSFELMADLGSLNLVDESPSIEAQISTRDELRRLFEIVDTLPPQQRRVFLLRRVEDRTPTEIALELGLSVSTVEKHLARAIEEVTRALAEIEPATEQPKGLSSRRTRHRP